MKGLHIVTWILLIIGGLNWLLIGLGAGDLVMTYIPSLAKIIYILVGISAVVEIISHKKNCKCCNSSSSMSSQSM